MFLHHDNIRIISCNDFIKNIFLKNLNLFFLTRHYYGVVIFENIKSIQAGLVFFSPKNTFFLVFI